METTGVQTTESSNNYAKAGTHTSDAAHRTFSTVPLADNQVQQTNELKTAAMVLWDKIDAISISSGETVRLVAIAKTHLETAVAFAVKAISRQDKTNV